MNKEFTKLRDREPPTFANINLLGPCNVDCYFCLGKDIDEVWKHENQTKLHYSKWLNFEEFLAKCKDANIKYLYITGQNTDALVYKYLDSLIDYLQNIHNFDVGIRTNGYLAHKYIDILNKCKRSVGFSIHTLNPEVNWNIMRRKDLPNWNLLLDKVKHSRVSIVLNRFNKNELDNLINYISQFNNVKYIQIRKICTDTREDYLYKDAKLYEEVLDKFTQEYQETRKFYGASCYQIKGKEVVFWRTVKTSIGSFNYYTDGSYTEDYFVIEGYQNKGINYPRINSIPIQVNLLKVFGEINRGRL